MRNLYQLGLFLERFDRLCERVNGMFPAFRQKIDLVYFPGQAQKLTLRVYDIGPERQASVTMLKFKITS